MKRLGTSSAAVIICALTGLAQSADFSTSDHASGLKPGQYKVIDGVMHTYAVAPGSRPVFVVGLPDQFQRRLAPSIAVLQSKTASQQQLAAAHKAVSDAFVEYWSEPLPTARRTLLRDAYARAARVTLQTQAEIAAGRLTTTAALDRYAEIAADCRCSGKMSA